MKTSDLGHDNRGGHCALPPGHEGECVITYLSKPLRGCPECSEHVEECWNYCPMCGHHLAAAKDDAA